MSAERLSQSEQQRRIKAAITEADGCMAEEWEAINSPLPERIDTSIGAADRAERYKDDLRLIEVRALYAKFYDDCVTIFSNQNNPLSDEMRKEIESWFRRGEADD